MRASAVPVCQWSWSVAPPTVTASVVMAIGGLVAILDRRYRVRRTADAAELAPGAARKTV